jgi:hypothetical protein
MRWMILIDVRSETEYAQVTSKLFKETGERFGLWWELDYSVREDFNNGILRIRFSSGGFDGRVTGRAVKSFYYRDDFSDFVKLEITAKEFLDDAWNDIRGVGK